MARKSLRNILKTSSGQLAETSTEELSKLSGRDIQPIQPLETSVIGGNEDQTKMAGTKAQRTSALRQAIQEPQELSTVLRRQQVRKTATEKEQEQAERASKLEQLGSLEGRVEQLAEQAIEQVGTTEADVELGITAGSDEERALLERIRSNPEDLQAIAEFNRLKGRTRADNVMSSEEILQQFDTRAGLGEALAASVADGINTGMLNFQDMGFADENEVADLIGIAPDQLAGMSIQELVDQVNAQIQDEYTEVEDLQQKASDQFLGAAERAEARKALREAGAVGVRSVESDIDNLADEIAEANTVSFMGQEMQIEEMLSDDHLSGVVAKFFDDPNFAKDLRENEPELVNFINKHENILKEAAQDVSESIKEFAAIQQENQKVSAGLSDDIMKEIIPGFGEITAERYNINETPLLSYVNNPAIPRQAKQTAISNMNNLASKFKAAALDIKDLDEENVRRLGFDGSDPIKLENLTDYYQTHDQFNKIIESKGKLSVDDMLSLVYPDKNKQEAMKELKDLAISQQSGFGPKEKLPISYDSTTDSLNFKPLARYFEQNFAQKKPVSYLVHAIPQGFKQLRSGADQTNTDTANNSAYNLIKDKLQDNPILSTEDVSELKGNISINDINTILDGTRGKNVAPPSVREALKSVAQEKFTPELDNVVVSNSEAFSSLRDIMGHLQGGATEHPEHNQRILENTNTALDALRTRVEGYAPGTLQRTMIETAIKDIENSNAEYLNQHNNLLSAKEEEERKQQILEEHKRKQRARKQRDARGRQKAVKLKGR